MAMSVVLSSPPGSVCGTVASEHVGRSHKKEQSKQFYCVQIFHPPGRPALINRRVTQTCCQTIALTRIKSGHRRLAYKKGAETQAQHNYCQTHLHYQQNLHRQESGTLLSSGSREVKKRRTWMDSLCSLSGLDPLWVSLRSVMER